jgi:hypothetical protein
LAAIGVRIAVDLAAPDVIALQEVQDQNGSAPGELSGVGTYAALASAIRRAGGPIYLARDIAPAAENTDGGQPNGNIRVAFLIRTDRVSVIERGTAGPSDAVRAVPGAEGAGLSLSPGRIEPLSSAFAGSRKPLALEVEFNGHRLILINLHLTSKSGDEPLFGANQPPSQPSAEKRLAQAERVRDFVRSLLTLQRTAKIVVLGDVNDFEFSATVAMLKSAPLENLVEELPPPERYTFNYEGNSQTLDHVFVSNALFAAADVDVVHVNADYAEAGRASDHDPVVARFFLPLVE